MSGRHAKLRGLDPEVLARAVRETDPAMWALAVRTQDMARSVSRGLPITDALYVASYILRHATLGIIVQETPCHMHHRGEGAERTGCNCLEIAPYLHTRMDLWCPST